MQLFAFSLILLCGAAAAPQQQTSALQSPAPTQKISPFILSAKTVFFEDRTGVPAVGKDALAQLKKWGRFQLVPDKSQADLILVLSAQRWSHRLFRRPDRHH